MTVVFTTKINTFTHEEKSFRVQFLVHCRDRKFTTGVRIDFITHEVRALPRV